MSVELGAFAPWVQAWFSQRFGRPTPVQALGWPPIIAGEHALLHAPTGSGKTLAAFLWGIDSLYRELLVLRSEGGSLLRRVARESSGAGGVRLLYVSPLKALNNDIERNLREPLAGVRSAAAQLGEELPALRTAVRTGDTSSSARAAMARKPPHLLITTPESLYLMLTSSHAPRLFADVRTLIVDEIHSLAGNKRGVHLALSLERLEHVAGGPVQRIGLSATQRPLEEIARFLGGQAWMGEGEARRLQPRPVTIVDAGRHKPLDLQVITAVPNFAPLPDDSIWPAVVDRVVDLIRAHRTTLIFANSRRLAERFAERLNERFGPGVIRAYHGSMSREVRRDLEQALKEGRLPALVATSSLELGIDIGSVDLVVQLQSPKGVTQGLQRVGRSGHLVGETSVGRIFATFQEDLMEAAVIARGMRHGEVEPIRTPRLCLDVLAQQIVAAVAGESWQAPALWDLFRQAYPYQELSWRLFASALEMLAGRYPAELFRQLRARIGWDRVNDRLVALPGSRRLAVTSGGTIPDRGAFGVYLADGSTKIGELDEEFVFEAREGDVFTLGTHTWRAQRITEDRVIVSDAASALPRLPFWRGEYPWRSFEVGQALGRFRRQVAARLGDREALAWLQREHALDGDSARTLLSYVRSQVEALGAISSDQTVILELFHDAIGDPRLVVHSPFGGRVNGAWGLALASALRAKRGLEVEYKADDDGILLRFPEAEADPPLDLLERMSSAEARQRILEELPNSAAFGAQFRQNAARALLLPGLAGRRRTPFWLQRLRARDLLAIARGLEDFPIVAETIRDCLRDVFDLEHLEQVLEQIQQGRIRVVRAETMVPSPLARGLLADFVSTYMYSWDAPKAERQLQALALSQEMLEEVLEQPAGLSELLRPEAQDELEARLQHTAPGLRARSAEELAQLLAALGDLSAPEIRERAGDKAEEWMAELARQRRVIEVELPAIVASGTRLPQAVRRWIAAELVPAYRAAFAPAEGAPPASSESARTRILRCFLRTHGPVTMSEIRARYALDESWLSRELERLVRAREVAAGRFTKGVTETQWCDRQNLGELHRRSLAVLRRQVEPVSLFSYADFLLRWQHRHPRHRARGESGLRQVLEQLRALWLPADLWEREVLPARVDDYGPELLDALCETGEVMWVGRTPSDQPARTRAAFLWRGEGGRLWGPGEAAGMGRPALQLSPIGQQIAALLEEEGACFRPDMERALGQTPAQLHQGLEELAGAGLVTNDSFEALRNLLKHRLPSHSLRAGPEAPAELVSGANIPPWIGRRPTAAQMREAKRHVKARLRATRSLEGRWSLVRGLGAWGRPAEREEQIQAWARLLLLRYGVLTRICLAREDCPWAWTDLYQWLQRMELRGEVRRGYFVDALPGAQFALPEAVEALREWKEARDEGALVVLSAYDPANTFGPELKARLGAWATTGRQPSSYYVLERGRPCLVAEGSRITTAQGAEEGLLARALGALVAEVTARRAPGLPRRFRVTHWNGAPVFESAAGPLLASVGFHQRPRDMVWWPE